MQEKDPDRPTPQQARQAAPDRSRQRHAKAERNGQPDCHPERERPADQPHVAVREEILGVAGRVGHVLAAQHPADVRMPETAQRPPPARCVIDMGTVRVARTVGETMMLAVGGDPLQQRPLDRHLRQRVVSQRVRPTGKQRADHSGANRAQETRPHGRLCGRPRRPLQPRSRGVEHAVKAKRPAMCCWTAVAS
jgi:hypothetical protein